MKKFVTALICATLAVISAFMFSACTEQTSAESGDYTYEYHIVDSSTIQTYVSGTNSTADICVLPVNLAAKLLGSGENYKMIGTLTHGNLYILGKSGSDEITADNIADLSCKTVGVVNLANVPGLTFEVILSKYNLGYEIDGSIVGDGAVKLVAISSDGAASYIASDSECDYYVVPEPAATTIINNTNGKDNARVLSGDLQELYGSQNGYPQAVVVAKNSLVGTTVLRDFITELGGVKEWLLDESTSVETIISVISANLTEGMTGSLSAKNLDKTVIENCCVYFTDAQSEKEAVTNIIAEYNSVSSSGFGSVADEFFYDASTITSYTEYSGTISVYAPDGAPALGLAKLMSEV